MKGATNSLLRGPLLYYGVSGVTLHGMGLLVSPEANAAAFHACICQGVSKMSLESVGDWTPTLRSITGGRGAFKMQSHEYRPVTGEQKHKVYIEKRGSLSSLLGKVQFNCVLQHSK